MCIPTFSPFSISTAINLLQVVNRKPSLAAAARDQMYIISSSDGPLTTGDKVESAYPPLESTSGATELIACRYDVVRGSDLATVNDEQEWDLTPYPLDRITGSTLLL